MQTATVTHIPTGQQWTVEFADYRPKSPRRKGYAVAAAGGVDSDGMVRCACGHYAPTSTRHATVNGRTVVLASVEADRIVNDHPAFTVDGGGHVDKGGDGAGYAPATTVAVCRICNDNRDDADLKALEAAALEALQAHGQRL